MKAEVVIIGGGIIGASIARELSQYDVDIVLVEKESNTAFGSTKANTGIIHAGYDDMPGTVKADLCRRGNALWSKLSSELDVPFKRIGSLVVALKDDDMGILEELKERGEKNRVLGLEIVGRDRLFQMEPNLNEESIAALYAPTAGIADSCEMAIALVENAVQNGVRVLLETKVRKILIKKGEVEAIQTNRGRIEADYVINAAGLHADEISAMVGVSHFSITPRRGEYRVMDKKLGGFVNHILFPTPTPISKGIVVTPTIEGNLLIGPNAHDIEDKTDVATTSTGLEEVFRGAVKLVPKLSLKKNMIIANYAGLRAESSTGDFIIEAYDEVRGFINAAGIKSPGLTAAPAIAKKVVSILRRKGLKLKKKDTFNPHRKSIDRSIRELSLNKVKKLLAQDPKYGHIVCRCEYVTEGEVIEAIRRGATTLDGVKFRTRTGMGRCQGGFCTPRVIKILSRELGAPIEDVTKRGGNSHLLPYAIKSLLLGGGAR